MDLRAEIAKLDINGDGKINVSDAIAIADQHLAASTSPATVVGGSLFGGLLIGFIAGFAARG